MSAELRSEWKNEGAGLVGVVLIDEYGKSRGGVVRPGETVWLTETERVATANAPRLAKDNPFTNGVLRCVTPASQIATRRPIGEEIPASSAPAPTPEPDLPPEGTPPREERPATEETGAPPLPEGDPALGARAPGEEVGTPEVVAQAGTKRKPGSRGTTVKSGNPVAKEAPKEGTPLGVVVGQGGIQYAEQK